MLIKSLTHFHLLICATTLPTYCHFQKPRERRCSCNCLSLCHPKIRENNRRNGIGETVQEEPPILLSSKWISARTISIASTWRFASQLSPPDSHNNNIVYLSQLFNPSSLICISRIWKPVFPLILKCVHFHLNLSASELHSLVHILIIKG